MKFSSVLALASAYFLPQVAAVNVKKLLDQELDHIQNMTVSLGEAIKAWDGTNYTIAVLTINDPANATALYVANATDTLKQYPTTFDLNAAFEIASPVQFLAYAVNASVAELNKRYPQFKAGFIDSIVLINLKSLNENAINFADLLISYTPDYLQPVAQLLKRQITISLGLGIECFEGKKSSCVTTVVDPNRTRPLAIKYNAMHRDGSPIA